jgi:hypothetical protein
MVFWRIDNLILFMFRIIPSASSSQGVPYDSARSVDPEDDCQSVGSSCNSSCSGVSAFQSLTSSQRINSLKPKLKISVSRRSTLATNAKL